jgi:hypothetical protein
MTTLETPLLLSTATPTVNIDLSEIIRQASKSPLGIVALALIIIAVASYFFRKDSLKVRIAIFVLLLSGAGLLSYCMVDVQKAAVRANEKPTITQKGSGPAESSGPCSPAVTGTGNSVTSNCPPADLKSKPAGAR